MTHWGRVGGGLYNAFTTLDKHNTQRHTVHIRGNGLIRRQRQRNTPHKQTSTQKKEKKTEQSFSYALHYGKEQNYTQVKSKAQIKQLPFQLRQLSTQVVKNPDDH